jgi:hypothetical protein
MNQHLLCWLGPARGSTEENPVEGVVRQVAWKCTENFTPVVQVVTDVRKHFFTERVVKIWNSLPAEEANFCNVKVFSNFLDILDLHNYLSV